MVRLVFSLLMLANAAPARNCKVNPQIPDFRTRQDLIIQPQADRKLDRPDKPEYGNVRTTLAGRPVAVNYVRYHGTGPEPRKSVVFLCGGPAQCQKVVYYGIPPQYDVITLDPIGIGVNASPALTPEMKSLDSQAKAVQDVITKLDFKDYVINARSVGTATATTVAAKIAASEGMVQPKALLLEGTLGPKSLPSRDYVRDSQRAWSLLSKEDQNRFVKKLEEYHKRNPKEQSRALNTMFTFLKQGPKYTATSIKQLNEERVEDWPAIFNRNLKGSVQSLDNKSNAGESLYRAFGCQVIKHNPITNAGRVLFDKRLEMTVTDGEAKICGCRSVAEDYDPCRAQVKAPIVYLHGEYDPVAALSGARAHANCQTSAPEKKFIVLKDFGHFVSDVESPFESCAGSIYEAAFASNLSTLPEGRDWSQGCQSAVAEPAGAHSAH